MEVTAEYRAIFAEEAHEHLQEWETALLQLEHRPADRDLIHEMFRAIHTLKGSSGFIGLEKLQRVAHELESALQSVRDGAGELAESTIDLLFHGLDLSRRMLKAFSTGKPFEESIETFLLEIASHREALAGPQNLQPAQAAAPSSASSEAIESAKPLEAPGALGATGSPAKETAPSSRLFQLDLQVQASGREGYLRAFLVRKRLEGLATIVREDPLPEVLQDSKGRFAYTLTVSTNRDERSLREALNIDLLTIGAVKEIGTEVEKRAAKDRPAAVETRSDEVVRVSVERLDLLLNLVGELVIQNSGFLSVSEQLRGRYGKNPQIQELEAKTTFLAKITRDLQDGIMKVRMLPVNNVFSRFHRVVRDLARDSGKEIKLEVFGEQTEIDKKVMDRIGDPLVHLVRNAVDHGIEPRAERLASGKPSVGLIRLGAYQDGDHICIEVSDDGGGLDREAVLAKALEKGLVGAADASRLSNEQILGLIFLPGFSTARELTEVSGRGVGMDVVKRTVEALDGSLRLRSARGRGMTVTISLPLTMAIIPALLLEVGDSILAVPLSSVKEVLKVSKAEQHTVGGRSVIRLREEILALVALQEALGLGDVTTDNNSRRPVVVVDYEEKKIGLAVDRVLGNREIVIKSLSRHYREIEGLIGASILGDGRIALIVDVEALVRLYYRGNDETAEAASTGSVSLQLDDRPIDAAPAELSYTARAPATEPPPSEPPDSPSSSPASTRPQPGLEARPDCGPEALAAQLRLLSGRAITDFHNEGAIQASIAVSRMSGQEIRVSFPESQLVGLGSLAGQLGGEELAVCGIYVGLTGELAGSILMVLPDVNLLRFHELFYRLPAGSCQSLAEVDLSAMSELGNVLSASFINALADGTHLQIRSEAPEIVMDMCQSVIDTVLARFNRPGEQIVLTKALLYLDDSQQVVCNLLLFLEPESLTRLLALLGGETNLK